MQKKFTVNPWEVTGEVDYGKLIKEFGVQPLSKELIEKIEKKAGGTHLYLRRGLFFSHRDFDVIMDEYEKGKEFVLYTGRGPSGRTHLGHLIPWIFTAYLQKAFGCKLYFQMTDDEKFLMRDVGLEEAVGYSYDNALDVIAAGMEPGKTVIFSDVEYIKTIYRIALDVAKRVTFSTAKAVFGFTNSSNIGIIFFPAVQASPAFMAQMLEKRNVNCLIPCAIDQDPYWRIARDVAPALGMPKPAGIYSKFLPGLQGVGGKMSASKEDTAIYTTDSAPVARKKVMAAFTGGRATVAEQKEKGGNPEVCVVHQWLYYMFEENDEKLRNSFDDCKAGRILCGECKKYLADKVCRFLEEHQKKRENAKKEIDRFMVKD
ncbi:tryptophan--tRNA ligase [Candidatus Micrarchaeota archaeon]|nr:tryptophan--tRNA ligase [Candidatus Micrarchaeota archaeon]